MRIVATADLHGNLPEIPECDLLLIAGDICLDGDVITQVAWLQSKFTDWLNGVKARKIVMTPGNHDFVFQEMRPSGYEFLKADVLIDETIEFEGLKIHAFPWVPNLPNWAFHATNDKLQAVCDAVPDDVDILVTHGPPYKMLDKVRGNAPVGSKQLRKLLTWGPLKDLKLHVFGHIHEGHGQMRRVNDAKLYNVSLVDETYAVVEKPREVTI